MRHRITELLIAAAAMLWIPATCPALARPGAEGGGGQGAGGWRWRKWLARG